MKIEPPKETQEDNGRYMALDLGTVNLVTIVTNVLGLTPHFDSWRKDQGTESAL